MENNQTVETPAEDSEKHTPLYDMTRKVMLAAIGAVAIAQEELDGFLNRLADRGELAERDARKLAEEMKQKRESMVEERRAQRYATRNAATKEEIDALSARVAELTRQLDELKHTQGQGSGSL